ncbi:Arogenate dehydratase/prephenate dehydratase 1, chloroplastic [Sesamum angolense]|uniref:arogenate dehydratase n=1 Tax=Sesamum angolense TaxID=2727404 RepID=A0AAE2BIJ8_9LAMI|nr:Arogenate dehydratase/prephenate dehydratase 1, chloroplastic [Sesamum angolense]
MMVRRFVLHIRIPGAYSETAALKAYPSCETVPCDQFEAAFKAVELWLVDRAVLPIENSVGGSIHRNYDLLLRHRLHIVGEVKLIVNHCLPRAAWALDQCEMTLNQLGVTRVSAADTAGAAQTSVVFSLEEGPGVLFKALAVFALRGINLSKIESRPQKRRPLRLLTTLTGEAPPSMAEPRAQYALGHLQEFARFLRVLGCYPMDTVL